ncbi:MAG TPA: transporter substrate-binding domain-containing protein [Clostridiales bacterium]|nr:transporter substrate-binding domain-containing protein [Clostridiales bacterium]
MKRFLAITLAFVLVLSGGVLFSGCNKKEAKTLVCGVTEFEPMNYKDTNGNWTGFDTEFAKLVGEKLGMEVKFQEIEWSGKYVELEAGTIDCIWNGFTANSSDDGKARSEIVDFSYGYMLNQQCVVVKADAAENYKSADALKGKKAVAEKGSAGEAAAQELVGEGVKVLGVAAQINSFAEVKSGASDFAVIDILLAQKLVGKGDYGDLAIADITLDSEIYAIGFKKGSDLTQKVNAAILELEKEGKLAELAEKYGLENSLKVSTDPIA